MDNCVLIKPSLFYESDIQAFREEMLNANSFMDGTGPLKRMENIKEWLEFSQRCENEETVPENWIACEQFIYVRETDNKIVGMIQFRHCFNEFLEKYGGCICQPKIRSKGVRTFYWTLNDQPQTSSVVKRTHSSK